MTLRTIILWLAAFWLACLVFSGNVFAGNPPRPEPHPSSCKKGKPCKAKIDPRPYRVVITWRIEDENGNVSYAPGTCLRTKRGLVDCTITFRW